MAAAGRTPLELAAASAEVLGEGVTTAFPRDGLEGEVVSDGSVSLINSKSLPVELGGGLVMLSGSMRRELVVFILASIADWLLTLIRGGDWHASPEPNTTMSDSDVSPLSTNASCTGRLADASCFAVKEKRRHE